MSPLLLIGKLVPCALAVVALTAWLAPTTAQARDRHRYPRTYHLWGGWTDKQLLAKYDMVVGFAHYDVSYLRARNPRGIFLFTPALRSGSHAGTVHITSGAIDTWAGGRDRLGGGIDLGYIRPFDRRWDYLWNANGTLARRHGAIYGWNLPDPTRHGTAELVAKLYALAAEQGGIYRRGWNGIHSDNWIFLVGAYGDRLDIDRDGRVDGHDVVQRTWCNGLARVGRLLRSYMPGKIVGGNGNWFKPYKCENAADPQAWLKTSNYTLIENFQQFYDSPEDFLRIARRWLQFRDPHGQPRYMAVLQDAYTCTGAELRLPDASAVNELRYMLNPCVMRSMRWGLTLALMRGVYYEIWANRHATRWWYDEYDGGVGIRRRGYLGRPTSRARLLANGILRRHFANGLVLNNSTNSAHTVRLGQSYRHLRGLQNPRLNNGQWTRSVTIPAHDGVILLR